MQMVVFLIAASILVLAQIAILASTMRATRSNGDDALPSVDVLWTALPGVMLLALLVYSLLA
jgi:heme/copper-type cytochrome/quinol oxidase subunit 2